MVVAWVTALPFFFSYFMGRKKIDDAININYS